MKAIYPFVVLLTVLLCASPRLPLPTDIAKEQFSIQFFSAQIPLEFAPDMRITLPTPLGHREIETGYRTVSQKPLEVLLNSLLSAKAAYELNDFLFLRLAHNSLSFIYQGRQTAERELTLFALLAKAGFDTKLTYKDNRLFINVYTEDELFEVPLIEHKQRNYANLSCLLGADCQKNNALYVFQEQPNPQGKSFDFQLKSWPKLPPNPTEKSLSFSYQGEELRWKVQFDKTIVQIMKDYPFLSEYCYLDAPLSPTLANTLIAPLQNAFKDKSLAEKLSFLATFTRAAFPYQDDNVYFGRSKPMVPEEVFSYEYSDCEDRCALFFALSKILLDIPVLVIAYDDHLSLAVGSDDIPGDHFRYNNRRYVFCDPTGPANSHKIGEIPNGYEGRPFEVIYAYK